MSVGFGRLVLRCSLVGIFLTLLNACGFQLRSYSFSGELTSFAIVGRERIEVATALRAQLTQAGLIEMEPSQAALVLDLMDQRRDRRSASTSGGGRATEYETSLAVRYRILDTAGTELSAPTWIERQRVYRIDQSNIVGSSEERLLLDRELVNDIAGQMLLAMEAVSRRLQDTSPSPDAG